MGETRIQMRRRYQKNGITSGFITRSVHEAEELKKVIASGNFLNHEERKITHGKQNSIHPDSLHATLRQYL